MGIIKKLFQGTPVGESGSVGTTEVYPITAASAVYNEAGGNLEEAIGHIQTVIDGKQETLESGTNIKTVNSNSLLGSGNIEVGTYSKPAGGIPTTDLAFNPCTSDISGGLHIVIVNSAGEVGTDANTLYIVR